MIGAKIMIIDDDGSVVSVYHVKSKWELRPVTAKCIYYNGSPRKYHATPPPDEGCNCGIHAWDRKSLMENDLYRYLDRGDYYYLGIKRTLIVALVELTGKVIVHEKGYRAERAQMVGFIREGSPKYIERMPPFGLPIVGLDENWERGIRW